MTARRYTILAAAVLASACASNAAQPGPALLIQPGAESHAELVRVVGEALSAAQPVLIADDALTRDSTLFIERKPARDMSGQRLNGRDLEAPERFQLVTDGKRCALLHERTGKRYPLEKSRCKPSG